MRYEVTEVCPECMSENTMIWNVELDGYRAYCPHCGEKTMLCDECLNADDNPTRRCDWFNGTCFRDK